MVKVGLHSEPSSQRKTFGCFFHAQLNNPFNSLSLFFFFFSHLPSIYGLEWPDINWAIPVSGDHSPLPCSHTTHDVIHTSDDGNFGKTHECILKVFRFLQRLHRLHPELKVTFTNSALQFSAATCSPPSPASLLVFSAAGKQTPYSSTSSTSVQCLMIGDRQMNLEGTFC